MAWSNTKTAIVVSVGLLFAAGTTTVAVKEVQKCEAEPWRLKYDPAIMAKLPPRVEILPALCLRFGSSYGDNDNGRMGLGAPMIAMVESADNYKHSQARIIAATPLPGERMTLSPILPPTLPRYCNSNSTGNLGWLNGLKRLKPMCICSPCETPMRRN